MTNAPAERAQDVRDLRNQIQGLQSEDEREMIFRDTSPRRPRVRVWSMVDGEQITIPRYLMEKLLDKRQQDGTYLFTARQNEAPARRLGQVKCFLHPDAPERVILDEIGLNGATCPAEHLASRYSKRIHGMHRHKNEWAAYQEFLDEQERDEARAERQQQLAATLALAGRAADAAAKGRP